MFVLGRTIITDDIADKHFLCDIGKCKGQCCLIGDRGAPLEENELPILRRNFKKIKPYLTENGIQTIQQSGCYQKNTDGGYSTPTVKGRACAYATYDEDKGTYQCGIEQAYRNGVTDFPKPLSCHLYPLRITRYENFDAVNYHKWTICKAACTLGKKLGIPLYKFTENALVRRYGRAWYTALVHQIEGDNTGEENLAE